MPGYVLFSVSVACWLDCVIPVNKCKIWELTPEHYFCVLLFANRGHACQRASMKPADF